MKTAIGSIVLYLGILVGGLTGWVLNVLDIIATAGGPITGLFLARCIGTVVFPLGALLGLLT